MAQKRVIVSIKNQIDRLIADHTRLSLLCHDLSKECESLKREKSAMQEELQKLSRENSRLQLCEGLSGSSESRDKARARVNHLMREVDKCIALLTSMDSEVASEEVDEVQVESEAVAEVAQETAVEDVCSAEAVELDDISVNIEAHGLVSEDEVKEV